MENLVLIHAHNACQFCFHSHHSNASLPWHTMDVSMFLFLFWIGCFVFTVYMHIAQTHGHESIWIYVTSATLLAAWINEWILNIHRTANNSVSLNLMSFLHFVFYFKGSISILQIERWSMEEFGATQSIDKSTFS